MVLRYAPWATLALVTLSPTPGIAAPTGGSVSVYGAVGDGTTDDTAAFNQCLANNYVCWVDPAKIYAVGNVQMKSGRSLVGLGVNEYGAENAGSTASRPVLVLNGVSGVSSILDVTNVKDGGAIQGLFIDCKGSTSVNGITGGSFQLNISNTTVVGCNNGFGSSAYSGEAHITDSTFGGNVTGISGLIDSLLVNVDVSNNSGDGIYLGAGANANTIVNSRFEFNQGFGLESYGGTSNNAVSNSLFDHNYKSGVRLVGVTQFTLSNSTFNRNGRNATGPDQNAQIYLSGATNVSITGGTSVVGQDDGGTGAFSPAYLFSYDTATASSHVTIAGFATSGLYNATSNRTGSYTVAAVEGTEPAVGYDVSGVFDIPNTASTVTGLSAAAGGGQAGATLLPASIDTVSTVSAPNASVKLAGCAVGRQQTVANAGANAMQVFGSGSDTINGAASGTGVSQPAGKVASYICTASGKWSRLLSN